MRRNANEGGLKPVVRALGCDFPILEGETRYATEFTLVASHEDEAMSERDGGDQKVVRRDRSALSLEGRAHFTGDPGRIIVERRRLEWREETGQLPEVLR